MPSEFQSNEPPMPLEFQSNEPPHVLGIPVDVTPHSPSEFRDAARGIHVGMNIFWNHAHFMHVFSTGTVYSSSYTLYVHVVEITYDVEAGNEQGS